MVFKLGDLLAKHKGTGHSKSDDLFDFLSLIRAWPEIVGPKLAEMTIPLKNQFKTLTILSNHPAFAQQLSFMEPQIKQKIIERFPNLRNDINQIKFVHNTEHFNQQKLIVSQHSKSNEEKKMQNMPHPHSPEAKRMRAEANALFANIEDNEIRENMISIYIQSQFTK